MGKIETFKSLMSEFFYDWGFAPNPQINKDGCGFWVNKTSIQEFKDEVILSYKMDSYVVKNSVYEKFKEFYNDYENDPEFEQIITDISNEFSSKTNLVITKTQIKYGDLVFIKNEDHGTYYNSVELIEISEELYEKVERFFNKIKDSL